MKKGENQQEWGSEKFLNSYNKNESGVQFNSWFNTL